MTAHTNAMYETNVTMNGHGNQRITVSIDIGTLARMDSSESWACLLAARQNLSQVVERIEDVIDYRRNIGTSYPSRSET